MTRLRASISFASRLRSQFHARSAGLSPSRRTYSQDAASWRASTIRYHPLIPAWIQEFRGSSRDYTQRYKGRLWCLANGLSFCYAETLPFPVRLFSHKVHEKSSKIGFIGQVKVSCRRLRDCHRTCAIPVLQSACFLDRENLMILYSLDDDDF